MSSVKLAEVARTARQQINKLANGERKMTKEWAERLAPPLGIHVEDLMFPRSDRVYAPLLSWVSAGRLSEQDGVTKTDISKYVLAADLPKGDWIALEVQGESMNRIAPDGSLIFVDVDDKTLTDGGFYVFGTPEGEATFKRYLVAKNGRPARLQPYSTDPNQETLPLAEGTVVVGRVGRVVVDIGKNGKPWR